MNELDELLSWDVKLTLGLFGVALTALVLWLIVPPLVHLIQRLVHFVQTCMRRDQIFKDKRYEQNYRRVS